jgi:thiol:disulfide interchange protein DsbD
VLGFVLFFALAAGMGLPYVFLAVAAGSVTRLPRSGEWLVWIERLFGCVLLAMAAYFVGPLLAPPLRHGLLPVVVALSGLYLGFIDPSGTRAVVFRAVKWSAGVAALAFALWLGWPQPAQSAIQWRVLTVETPTANGRPMIIEFAAEWCIPCGEMARTTFIDPKVVRAATRFEMVKADITEENDHTRQLLERFDVRGVPTVLVFDARGQEVQRLVGYTGPDELLTAMTKAEGAA